MTIKVVFVLTVLLRMLPKTSKAKKVSANWIAHKPNNVWKWSIREDVEMLASNFASCIIANRSLVPDLSGSLSAFPSLQVGKIETSDQSRPLHPIR